MGRTLILYATRHGCTARAANLLAQRLGGEIELAEIGKGALPDLAGFDTLIVGGSIHAGQVQKSVKRLCEQQVQALLAARLGLFLCHMYEGEIAKQQFAQAFPAELREHTTATGLFRGVLDFKKMGFIERAIVKKVAGVTAGVDALDLAAIEEFAHALG